MSPARFAPLVLAGLCLSACAERPTGAVSRYPAAATSRPVDAAAVASLPAGAGRVVALRRIPYANGISDEVVLEGPRAMAGENRITVQALTTASGGGPGATGDVLRIGPPSDADIAAEMDRALPGVPMRISGEAERDVLGPIAYAVGSAGRLNCVYAWQYVAPSRPLTLLEGLSETGELPMSARVRLCGERPAATLIADLRGLTIGGRRSATLAPAGPAGDALEAAVGSPAGGRASAEPLAARADAPAADFEPQAAEAAPGRGIRHRRGASLAQRALRRRARRIAFGRRSPRRHAALLRRAAPAPERAGTVGPRLPLPNDLATEAVSPPPARAAAVAPSPRAAAAEADALPLPR